MSKPDIEALIGQASLHHPTINFTAETFDTETAFLDMVVYKGTRFKEKSILDAKTHFKQMETFLHTHFTLCHHPSVWHLLLYLNGVNEVEFHDKKWEKN